MDRNVAGSENHLRESVASILRPAPYGRACSNCVRAKCKCILRGNGSCERCFRLKKDCNPSSSIRKKRSTARGSSNTARLEQKLDGLVSLLKANSQGSVSADTVNTTATIPSPPPSSSRYAVDNNITCIPSVADDSRRSGQNHLNGEQDISQPSAIPVTPASSSSFTLPYSLSRDAEPTAEEAELWYHVFQTKHADHIPFVVPYVRGVSSTQLRQEKPYLWLSIMAVACPSVQKQTALGKAVREFVAKEVVVGGERTIDLFLCILCFIQWCHYHIQAGPIITVFSNLAVSILVDLELDKLCPNEFSSKHPGRLMLPKFGFKKQIPQSRTMEHRRLALACYTVNSSCAAFHNKTESISWTPYFEESLKLLEEAKESPADELQVYQVKVQQILSNISLVYSRLRGAENEHGTRLVVPYLHSFQKQLIALKSQIPDNLEFMHLTLLYVEVAINETALVRTQSSNLIADKEFDTMKCLLTCVEAIQSWIDLFFSFDAADYVGIPFTCWKQIGLIILTTVRLVTLEDPAWDVDHVRRSINLPGVLEHIHHNLTHTARMTPNKVDSDDNIYMRSRKYITLLLNWVKAIYEGSPATNIVFDTMNESFQPAGGGGAAAPLGMMNNGVDANNNNMQQNSSASTAATAAAFTPQVPIEFPMEIFPHFNPDPWNGDVFGLWDLYSYSGGRMYSSMQ